MTEDRKIPRAPAGLGSAGAKLWRGILADFEPTSAELAILEQACREADLIGQLEADLIGQSFTVPGVNRTQVVHPLIPELRQHRNTFRSLLSSLKLPDLADETVSDSIVQLGDRKMTRSEAGKKAASARWDPSRRGQSGKGA